VSHRVPRWHLSGVVLASENLNGSMFPATAEPRPLILDAEKALPDHELTAGGTRRQGLIEKLR
jgi:hypothetical protein